MKIRMISDAPCAGAFIEIELVDCPDDADVEFEWLNVPDGLTGPPVVQTTGNQYEITPLPAGSYLLKATCCVSNN